MGSIHTLALCLVLLLAVVGTCIASPDTLYINDLERSVDDFYDTANGIPLRYLSINVGNFALKCWESKLCDPTVVQHIREYINEYQPDIILITEMTRASQLMGTDVGGPLLPQGYTGLCGQSVNRFTMEPAAWDEPDASHEHECIAWKKSRLQYVNGTAQSVYGRNDAWGQKNCDFDFTSFRVALELALPSQVKQYRLKQQGDDAPFIINAVIVHPDSKKEECRTYETAQYWKYQPQGFKNTIIGGDWNAGMKCYLFGTKMCENITDQINFPNDGEFQINFSNGQHWYLGNTYPSDPTSVLFGGSARLYLDHSFSSFGTPCTDCGRFYNGYNITRGSVVGGFDGMPRADGGSGCDHRQLLVDMWIN